MFSDVFSSQVLILKTRFIVETPQLIPIDELSITQLTNGQNVTGFCCEDKELENFLLQDALAHQKNMVATTYLCLFQLKPVGYFSICTDAISLDETEKQSSFGKDKPYRDYPALKIARLATHKDYQKRGIGTYMVKLAIGKALSLSTEMGCRFVTVDAYPKSYPFYKKFNFIDNLADKKKRHEPDDTISIRLDLIHLKSASSSAPSV